MEKLQSATALRRKIYLICLTTLPLILSAISVWLNFPLDKDLANDSALGYHLIQKVHLWGTAFDLSIMKPGVALGNNFMPINIWANPGYILANIIDPPSLGILVANLFWLVALFLSFLLLSLRMGLNFYLGLSSSLLASLFLFHPWTQFSGFHFLLLGNPGFAWSLSISSILSAALIKIAKVKSRSSFFASSGLFLIGVAYLAWSDPFTWSLTLPLLIVVFLMAYYQSGHKTRFVFLAIGITTALFLSGAIDFFLNMKNTSARNIFASELHSTVQEHYYAGLAYNNSIASVLFYISFLSAIALFVIKMRRKERWSHLVFPLSQLGIICMGFIYLYYTKKWPYPAPNYFEVSLTPLIICYPLLLLQNILSQRERAFSYLSIVFLFLTTITLLLCSDNFLRNTSWITRVTTLLENSLKTSQPRNEIITYLESNIKIRPGSAFRGTTASFLGINPSETWGPPNRFSSPREDGTSLWKYS